MGAGNDFFAPILLPFSSELLPILTDNDRVTWKVFFVDSYFDKFIYLLYGSEVLILLISHDDNIESLGPPACRCRILGTVMESLLLGFILVRVQCPEVITVRVSKFIRSRDHIHIQITLLHFDDSLTEPRCLRK